MLGAGTVASFAGLAFPPAVFFGVYLIMRLFKKAL